MNELLAIVIIVVGVASASLFVYWFADWFDYLFGDSLNKIEGDE